MLRFQHECIQLPKRLLPAIKIWRRWMEVDPIAKARAKVKRLNIEGQEVVLMQKTPMITPAVTTHTHSRHGFGHFPIKGHRPDQRRISIIVGFPKCVESDPLRMIGPEPVWIINHGNSPE